MDFLSTVRQDVGYGLRKFRKEPGFVLVVVLTLALSIGLNGTVFGLLDAVLLRPLHGLHEPERLVTVDGRLSYPAYRDLRDENPALAGLAAHRQQPMAWGGDGRTELVSGGVVTGNYFSLLGVAPALGRILVPGDDQTGAVPVAVVSHAFWRRALGGGPGAVGREVRLNGLSVQVVGVMPAGFRGTELATAPDVWVPVALWPRLADANIERRGWMWLGAVGRLKPGATLEQAQAALDAAVARQKETYRRSTPSDYALKLHPSALAATGMDQRGAVVGFVVLLTAMAAVVLLIGCANVANLMLAKAMQRRTEIAVRMALGSSGNRLVRQLLTESMILCLAAGAAGLLVVRAVVEAARRFTLPGGISLAGLDLSVDGRVVAVTAALSLLTGLLFGLAPALQAVRSDSMQLLRAGVATPGRRQATLRGAVLAVQVALTLVLLVGAGLFVRTMSRALGADLGFRTDGVVLASVDLGAARYDPSRAEAFYADAASRVRGLPGVHDVSWVSMVPMTDATSTVFLRVPGYDPPDGESPETEVNYVGAHFLRTLGIPLVRGREFDERDGASAARVAMVNETMARRFWPGSDPLGGWFDMDGDTVTVVGVVKDVAYHRLGEETPPYAYLPTMQHMEEVGPAEMTLVLRADGAESRLVEPVTRELHAAGADVPIFQVGTLTDRFAALLMPQRLGAALLSGFGVLALLVAAVGIYGLTAYVVGQRTREIGIRMMLGAPSARVLWMVLAQSTVHAVVGVVAGIALALAAGRVAVAFLYGVTATDPLTFAAASVMLVAVVVMAALIPAQRATRIAYRKAIGEG